MSGKSRPLIGMWDSCLQKRPAMSCLLIGQSSGGEVTVNFLESSSIKSSKSNGLEKVFCRFGSNSTSSLSKKERITYQCNEGKMVF